MYKILTGQSQHIENELNRLSKKYSLSVEGSMVHESRLTIIVRLEDQYSKQAEGIMKHMEDVARIKSNDPNDVLNKDKA